eukprot:gene15934-22066_t
MVKPIECIVRAGEAIFVPSGWWHMAINLEDSLAVTQNFASSTNLPQVLEFLQTRNVELVSGCSIEDREGLHDRFVAALKAERPELMERLEKQAEEKRVKAESERKLASLFNQHKQAQTVATTEEESEQAAGAQDVGAAPGGFSFAFKF